MGSLLWIVCVTVHEWVSSTVGSSTAVTCTVWGTFQFTDPNDRFTGTPGPAPRSHCESGVAMTVVGPRGTAGNGSPGSGVRFKAPGEELDGAPSVRLVGPATM